MVISAEHRSKFVSFTGNGEVSIWVKNSQMGRKTPNKQKQTKFVVLYPANTNILLNDET